MQAWRREAEALIAGVLGSTSVSWIAWDEQGELTGGRKLPGVVLTFIGAVADPAERMRALARIEAALTPDVWLVIVDHNRPRRPLAVLGALLGVPRVPGCSPAARWRRLAYPTARELQSAGFDVERLRFVASERVQVVFGRKHAVG